MTAAPGGRPTLAQALALGPVVLDGGLATELERRGHDLRGGLWSARLLLDDAGAVAEAHRAFFAAGAQVATTAAYQVSGLSLARAGHDPALASSLLRASVQVAAAARDELCPDGWVAGSVGPYGASLADGSEYTGDYHLGSHAETVAALRAFHRPRLAALADAGADVLACETLPRLAEVEALATELAALGVPAWVSLTVTGSPAGPLTRARETLAEALEPLRDVPAVIGVGVNCCDPADVEPALALVAGVTGRPGVAYPNSGEGWDAAAHAWTGDNHWDDAAPARWVDAGARLVGGCCRVTPDHIRRLAASIGGPSGTRAAT